METHTDNWIKILKDLHNGPCSLSNRERYGCNSHSELQEILNELIISMEYIREIADFPATGGFGRKKLVPYPLYEITDKGESFLKSCSQTSQSDSPKIIKLI